jgi:hypothetical protein
MLLYIVRHGDPIYVTDTLTDRGKLQAEAVGKRMYNAKIDKIFSSPMGRAMETAEPACRLLGIEKTIEEWSGTDFVGILAEIEKNKKRIEEIDGLILGKNESIQHIIDERNNLLRQISELEDKVRSAKREFEYEEEKPKKRKRKEKVEKILSEEITLSLISQGKTLQEVADERDLTIGTIYTHLAKLIHAKKIAIDQYVDADLLSRVMSILDQTPEMSNSELFEQLNGVATYDDLKLIRAHQLLVSSSLHYSNGDK